jgi:hypothetical protein
MKLTAYRRTCRRRHPDKVFECAHPMKALLYCRLCCFNVCSPTDCRSYLQVANAVKECVNNEQARDLVEQVVTRTFQEELSHIEKERDVRLQVCWSKSSI